MSSAILARLPAPRDAAMEAAREIAHVHGPRAGALDDDGSFPEAAVADLHRLGLLLAPFPRRLGGSEFASGVEASRLLFPILRQIGAADLSLGRLYEGHVNAAGLVIRYGRPSQVEGLSAEAADGTLLGVWNTDGAEGLKLVSSGSRWRLRGGKILCSGAGHIERPLVTAKDEDERVFMVVPRLKRGERADLSSWTPLGMRASATGAVDFTDIVVEAEEIIGEAGAYQRQPAFSGGAWRFAAVQLGGMERLVDLLREHLVKTKRGGDPYQSARVGECVIAVESARLWVERAAILAEGGIADSDAVTAYVNLARIAVERAALELLALVHRSVGLAAFIRPHPIERISRDLATYLRQPAPDRALTSAAAWALEQSVPFAEMWT
jgi:alkylation response protein AidB-like acyl-CoA dehydrogenase